jgi:hypothetical protein
MSRLRGDALEALGVAGEGRIQGCRALFVNLGGAAVMNGLMES